MFYLKTVNGVHIVTHDGIRYYFGNIRDALEFIREQKEALK